MSRRVRWLSGALITAAIALLLIPVGATAERNVRIGFADRLFESQNGGERALWQSRAKNAGGDLIRINLEWRDVVGSNPPARPTDPSDPAYDFRMTDAAVRAAAARNLDVFFTVYSAPGWAEQRRPKNSNVATGSWRPRPRDFGNFGQALASRYSGRFAGLPRVRYFEAWNEPNLTRYLAPQWTGKKQVAAGHYRKMLNAFHDGIANEQRGAKVIAGATSPYGEGPGGERTRPLRFLRELFCLKGRKRISATKCVERKARATFDVLSHHPINTSGGPRRSALHPDDASTPDMDKVGRVLRAAERTNRARGAKKHRLWATEFWWESNPPDKRYGVSLRKQAERYAETFYLMWKQKVSAAVLLQIRDDRYPGNTYQSGLYFLDGKAKPALTAARFPFVADRVSKRRVLIWGKSPVRGKLIIDKKRGKRGWRKVKSVRAKGGKVFTTKVRAKGSATYRARIGGRKSLPFGVKRK